MVHNHRSKQKYWIYLLGLVGFGWWIAVTKQGLIWPLRNIIAYKLKRQLLSHYETPSAKTILEGRLMAADMHAINKGVVLASEPNATLHVTEINEQGLYRLKRPAGCFVPIALIPGSAPVMLHKEKVWSGHTTYTLNRTLPDSSKTSQAITPIFKLGKIMIVEATQPHHTTAQCHNIIPPTKRSRSQPIYIYTPTSGTTQNVTILAVYPGKPRMWASVSIALAAAGYPVIATSPRYSFDIEHNIVELQQLVAWIQNNPPLGICGKRLVILAGSYSSIHAMQLLKSSNHFIGAGLLGSISDMFAMRRLFEEQKLHIPFGLDNILIALGEPHKQALRYAQYSALWHVQSTWPPTLLIHSNQDDVVPVEQSQRLAEELKRHNVPVETHFIDGLSHYVRKEESALAIEYLYTVLLRFLKDISIN